MVEGNSGTSFNESTKIINDIESIDKRLLEVIYNTKTFIDILEISSTLFTIEPLKMAITELKENKKIKSRYIIKVTKDNIWYCKQLISIVDEVHHLDEIKGNFLINEKTFANIFIEKKADKPLTQLLISNFKPLIEQQQFFFDFLWDKSIPAYQKINE